MVYQLSIFFNKSIVQKEDFLKMLGGGVWGGGGAHWALEHLEMILNS